eukprot:jgi/Chrzof1/14466/Cz09g03290.t1
MTEQPQRKLRILALHSFRTSAETFKEQFRRAKLDTSISDLVELEFIDAPHPATGDVPEDVKGKFGPPHYEWFSTERVKGGNEYIFTYNGLDASEAYVTHYMLTHGPFDGLLGFSQGGVMAATLAAQQVAGMALQTVPKLKFVVCIGSAMTAHPRHLEAMTGRVQLPSCHIIGHKDYIKEYSIELVRQFQAPIVIMHGRGHVVPNLEGMHLEVLRAFFKSFLQQPKI